MKKTLSLLSCMALLFMLSFQVAAQKKDITWTTKSEAAKKLAIKGTRYMVNFENAQAYDAFTAALELDPDFTIPLIFMASMTTGQTQTNYLAKATKSAASKTEAEKLLLSTIDPAGTAVAHRQAWSDLYDKYPDAAWVGAFYVFTRSTPQQQLIAGEEFIKKFPTEPSVYNILAFLYLQVKKDTSAAKNYFEKYIALYPEGCNPYDSMGEFYFDIGDMANSEKYYNLALEKYPFNISSIDKLKEIKGK